MKNCIFKSVIAALLAFAILLTAASCSSGTDSPEITDDETDTKIPPEEQTTIRFDPVIDPSTETETETETEEPYIETEFTGDASDSYLTIDGIDQISNKNIIIFIIDRFDVNYFEQVDLLYPGFFDDLDGFTYFSDNVSLYSRTYPAVTTMITGIDTDFSSSAESYFFDAYRNSPFLKDLKRNGYKIKIYTQNFYCYRDGTPFGGVADNLSYYTGDSNMYDLDDPAVCSLILNNGLSLDGNEKSYILIHLSGCHSPYNMDENANRASDPSMSQHLRGCMKMIYSYIDEMKRLGVYDDSTIVITGDHPAALSDYDVPWQPRLTALFVKPSGSTGKLKFSSAEVSQENLIPTLVKSAEIKTSNEYGPSYFEIQEGQHTVRHHKFQLCIDGNSVVQIVDLEVNGDGTDFSNWSVKSYADIGALYK
ncbi:MAG: sulfatase-like hydrolase/transferase [Clostridia bacterium]|nr:sulfatase-like hydrolase/transferase [Clostridia bacterium]